MPIVAQVVCDNCQTVKKHTNHWYASSRENNSFGLQPLAPEWATKASADSSLQYFCGRFCAVEALTRWMNNLYDETERFPINGKDAAIGRAFPEENSGEKSPNRDGPSSKTKTAALYLF